MTMTTEQLKGRAQHYHAMAKHYRARGDFTEAERMDCDADAFEELAATREAQPVGYIDVRCLEGKYPTGGAWSLRPHDLSGVNQVTPIYLAPPGPANVVPDTAHAIISAIEAEQERLHDEDYLMDSKDCIDVIREFLAAAQEAPDEKTS